MDAASWTQLAREFGPAVALLFGLGLLLMRVGKWARPHLERIFEGHLALLKQTTASVAAIEQANARTNSEVREFAQAVKALADTKTQVQLALVDHDRRSVEAFSRLQDGLDAARGEQNRKLVEHDAWARETAKRVEEDLRRLLTK